MALSGYKPIGGVEHAVLYPASSANGVRLSAEGLHIVADDAGIDVVLCDEGSLFEELMSAAPPPATVRHTLTLVAERNAALPWLDGQFIDASTHDGVLAAVTLADGRHLLCGYSRRLGAEQPMRIESIATSSGKSRKQAPTVTLTLASEDADFAEALICNSL